MIKGTSAKTMLERGNESEGFLGKLSTFLFLKFLHHFSLHQIL
jgi:hypothetical protein